MKEKVLFDFTKKADDLPFTDEQDRYIGHVGTLKFHRPACFFGKRIKQENRLDFDSLDEALEAGYTPCPSCRPGQ